MKIETSSKKGLFMDQYNDKTDLYFHGVAVSPGIAMGQTFILGGDLFKVEQKSLKRSQVDSEIEKFRLAVKKTKEDLDLLRKQAEKSMGKDQANIFDTHQMMLEDDLVVKETVHKIKTKQINADYAFFQVMNELEESFSQLKSEYLNSRSADLRDIKRRVVRHIQGDHRIYLSYLQTPAIILSKELTPSDTVSLDRKKVLGFATDLGGQTSHAAIMARSLKIPSVVGLVNASKHLSTGDQIILDGNEGLVIANPSAKTINKYHIKEQEYNEYRSLLAKTWDLPARTKDGKNIELSANIEFPEEVSSIKKDGAFGVGLYRTEYLFLAEDELPTEEEQFNAYSNIIKRLNNQPIIIRTLDVGGDKLPSSIQLHSEENPFLGLRGVRLYKNYKNIFKTQLRAILRSSVYGNVRILFPMISTVTEMRYCKNIIKNVQEELTNEGIAIASEIPLGATIEVPSAAIIADYIAKECDFLSIGTNDLIQYTLAVDRGNESVAYLYQSYDPAILRVIKEIIHLGHLGGVWVGMCGEMASDPLATMVLIGLGLDEFSVSPISISLIKEIIRRVDYTECENLVNKVLKFKTNLQVKNYLSDVLEKKFRDLLYCQIVSRSTKDKIRAEEMK
jgi:phosphotransferase system enzyme I (PtsI)